MLINSETARIAGVPENSFLGMLVEGALIMMFAVVFLTPSASDDTPVGNYIKKYLPKSDDMPIAIRLIVSTSILALISAIYIDYYFLHSYLSSEHPPLGLLTDFVMYLLLSAPLLAFFCLLYVPWKTEFMKSNKRTLIISSNHISLSCPKTGEKFEKQVVGDTPFSRDGDLISNIEVLANLIEQGLSEMNHGFLRLAQFHIDYSLVRDDKQPLTMTEQYIMNETLKGLGAVKVKNMSEVDAIESPAP